MTRPRAATVVVLLWLAALTFAFHGCPGCETLLGEQSSSVSLARKMLLAVESLDVASSASTASRPQDQQRHHRHHHHHHHHQQHNHHHGKWNWQGITPSAAAAGNGDARYGAEKRLVPTGPNPLHH